MKANVLARNKIVLQFLQAIGWKMDGPVDQLRSATDDSVLAVHTLDPLPGGLASLAKSRVRPSGVPQRYLIFFGKIRSTVGPPINSPVIHSDFVLMLPLCNSFADLRGCTVSGPTGCAFRSDDANPPACCDCADSLRSRSSAAPPAPANFSWTGLLACGRKCGPGMGRCDLLRLHDDRHERERFYPR